MRDFRRDWRRWTRAERIAFILLATVMVVSVPVAFGASVHAGGRAAEPAIAQRL